MTKRPDERSGDLSNDRRKERTNDWTRRDVLRSGGALGAGLGMAAAWPGASAQGATSDARTGTPGIRQRVTLGRTGLEIPDISFGTFHLESDEDLVRHALDRGITHFDTAESYTEGRAEKVLGRALAGRRHEVTITSKNWANAEDSAESQMEILEESLRSLKTDYIDLYLNHAVNAVERVKSEQWQSFTQKAKQQGKIRHVGLSGHAGRLTDCIEYALDEGIVDAILVAYNFAQQPSFKDSVKQYLNDWVPSLDIVSGQPRLPELLARAHSENVGVMVMKTLKGAKLNDMRPYEAPGRTFAQSAFRWVLSEPSVDGLVVTMQSKEMVDEFVAASGSGEPDREDLALLARYSAMNAGTTCTIGCGDCADACPLGVPIADVMRLRMYDLDYRLPEVAKREYRALERGAEACLSCSGAPCANVCPSGLDIPNFARQTARRLGGRRA